MRYIDADKLIKQMKDGKYVERKTYFQRGVNSAIDYWITEINHFPTTDVVPKSEVEALEKELANAYRQLDEAGNFYCSFTKSKIQNCPIDDEVANAKQEVAREIFEEIEKLVISDNLEKYYGYPVIAYSELGYAELKKKYTESEDKE